MTYKAATDEVRLEAKMVNIHWEKLENLVLVAGHAVYVADSFEYPANDSSWFLQEFQKGEPPFYIEHTYHGVKLTEEDRKSLLVFSGGQTRYEAGPKSEAQSYWVIADHFNWWWKTNVKLRATTEEFARDSFENLLFGICRFYECVRRYPECITVVSWAFKEERFELHRKAIRFPKSRFIFKGVNNPVDLAGAMKGEQKNAIGPFTRDPYGTEEAPKNRDPKEKTVCLGDKRKERNPFNRQHPYEVSCPGLADLLRHSGSGYYDGDLPWPKEWQLRITRCL